MSPEGVDTTDEEEADLPSEVPAERTWFDGLADQVIGVVSNASFFAVCMGVVLVWLVVGAVRWSHWHEWSDVLAVPAAGVTLIMVALLENESRRNDQAVQRKLNAMAKALADLMDKFDMGERDIEELRSAVGLELRESTSTDNDRASKASDRRSKRKDN